MMRLCLGLTQVVKGETNHFALYASIDESNALAHLKIYVDKRTGIFVKYRNEVPLSEHGSNITWFSIVVMLRLILTMLVEYELKYITYTFLNLRRN